MTVKAVVVAILLIVGVGLQLLACLGVVAMRDTYDRLHFTAPTGVAAAFIAAAILVQEGFSLIADKGLLVAAFALVSSPVLVHVTARGARIRERRTIGVQAHEEIEVKR